MNTLTKKPLIRKKALRKEYSVHQNRAKLEIVHNEFVSSKSDLSKPVDLFKDNADYISYGISVMSLPF